MLIALPNHCRHATPPPGTQPQEAAFTSGKGVHLFLGGWWPLVLLSLGEPICSVCLIGEDYLISGQPSKPLLNVWQVLNIRRMSFLSHKTISGEQEWTNAFEIVHPWPSLLSGHLPLWLLSGGCCSGINHYLAAGNRSGIQDQSKLVLCLATCFFSGALLAVLSRHYQSVTVLSFTKDGSHLISGGEDGQVLLSTGLSCHRSRLDL